MPPPITAGNDFHLISADDRSYVTVDGRFRVENTWTPTRNREPNWLLNDLQTGRSYRFFVLWELGNKMEELVAATAHASGPETKPVQAAGDRPPAPEEDGQHTR